MSHKQESPKVTLTFRQTCNLLGPYAGSRILEQIKSVSLIVAYLVLFQAVVLSIPVADSLAVAAGIGIVILGLAFFMEGLFLGLMPLGEVCGVKLPQKTVLPVILAISFILGLGATFAEPAIGVLKAAGSSVKPWDAPLLFLLLNKYSVYLVWAVGIGVGIAVLFGMLRFLYNWSLKPFIYILYAVGGLVSIWAYFNPNLVSITGLAWDCGGVTTGPVTVPLVLALGIGISRVASRNNSNGEPGGFGVVTLASAFPILAVMGLGIILLPNVPKPMSDVAFCSPENREKALSLFKNELSMKGYILLNGSTKARDTLFRGDRKAIDDCVAALAGDEKAKASIFGSGEAFHRWLLTKGSHEQQLRILGSEERIGEQTAVLSSGQTGQYDLAKILFQNIAGALQAIVPLSIFLIFIMVFILREKIRRADEIALGIMFSVIGMSLFNIGIAQGLSRLGGDIGRNLPSSFKTVALDREHVVIPNFDRTLVSRAITREGAVEDVFVHKTPHGYELLPYQPENFDQRTGQYTFTPTRGPLFAGLFGIFVVVFFGFMMGYGATLAEPALNALGVKVEELTVGTFKKPLLMQAVAIGVGVGIAFGVLKIIYDWPLIWMLVPPYILLIAITVISSEDFVNIGWDSAGVTTGPVTVPLVLAMGLGISSQMGSVEGFGILALASVWPVLSVLFVGLYVTRRREAELREVSKTAGV
jgi:hypothetical protein